MKIYSHTEWRNRDITYKHDHGTITGHCVSRRVWIVGKRFFGLFNVYEKEDWPAWPDIDCNVSSTDMKISYSWFNKKFIDPVWLKKNNTDDNS
jgi:hypothetical protein